MAEDTIDLQIIKTLARKARLSWADLAGKLKMSPPSTAERVRKLEERGIIRGYRAELDAEALGFALTAFIAVALRDHDDRDKFLKRVVQIGEVQECHHVAGDYDFLLKIRCRGTKDLDRLLTEDLKGRAGAGRTHTTIVLATHKETAELPI